jgi:hypothetical protein
MVLVLWNLQMFVSALFTHLLLTIVAVELTVLLTIFNATHQKVLAGTEAWYGKFGMCHLKLNKIGVQIQSRI